MDSLRREVFFGQPGDAHLLSRRPTFYGPKGFVHPMNVLSLFLLALLICREASPAASGSIEGLWLVENKEAHIRVERCGENLCARIVWMKDPTDEKGRPPLDVNNPDKSLRNRPILGINLLKEVPAEPDADGLWSGRIYDPQRGKYYGCA